MTNTKIIFFGSSDFSVEILKELKELDLMPQAIVTQPDRPKGRSGKLCSTPVKCWAEDNDLIVIDSQSEAETKAEKQAFKDSLIKFDADIFLTAAYGEYMPNDILDIPKLDSLNIHPSLLPKYRGASPVQSAIVAGEDITGTTLMRMTNKLDAGAIYAQRQVEIPKDFNSAEMMEKLAIESRYLIREALPLFIKGELIAKEQDESQATFTHILCREDGRIDFTKSATDVHNLIRGLNPWPTAFTYMDDKRVKVWQSRVANDVEISDNLKPGDIFCQNKRFFVKCGEGVIELLEIQFASKAKMSCAACAHNYKTGCRFDSYANKNK